MRIAVAIPTYGRDAALLNTIRDVLAQVPPADEVLVVDQSPCHAPDVAAELATLNLPAARNVTLRETTCEIVIFIDEVRLSKGFVQAHGDQHCRQDIAAVAGRIVDRSVESLPTRTRVSTAYARAADRFWRRPYPRRPVGYQHPSELDYLYLDQECTQEIESVANFGGGNHSIRRAIALAIGGYDERFIGRAVAVDRDMALRLWKKGYRIRFSADASLQHLWVVGGGGRGRGKKSVRWFYEECYGNLLFLFKHFYPRRPF